MPVHLLLLLSCILPICDAGPPPTPTPTARQELARFAQSHRVKKGRVGKVEIDDDFVNMVAGENSNAPSATRTPKAHSGPDAEDKKALWVRRFKEARERVKEAEEELKEIEEGIPQLWDRFYRDDHPEHRARVLAPQLREKLRLRSELRVQLDQLRQQFSELRVAARKAGAKPGWFRNP